MTERQKTFRTFTEEEVRDAIKQALYTESSHDAHKSYAYVDSEGYVEFANLIKSKLDLE